MQELKQEIFQALQAYPIEVRQVRFYAEVSHLLFIVYTPDEKLMLKVCRKNSFEKTLPDLLFDWVRFLQQEIPQSIFPPLKNKQGHYYTEIQCLAKVYYMVLYPWIPGRVLRSRLSLPNVKKWGRLLAQMHDRSALFSHKELEDTKMWDRLYYWEPCVLYQESNREFMPTKRKRIFKAMEQRVQAGLSRLHQTSATLLIHSDFHPRNLKVNQGQLYAYDFDDFMRGYPVQDIAIALLYIRHEDNFQHIQAAFKQGYQEIRPWPEQYPGQIQLFFMGRLLWIANACLYADEDEDESFEERFARYEKEFSRFLSNDQSAKKSVAAQRC